MDGQNKTIFQADKNQKNHSGSTPAVSQPQPSPSPAPQPVPVKLKQREKPLALAQKLADYVDKLPPVSFSFYDDNPNNPYSLPTKVGAVFVREGLMDDQGQVVFANKGKLNDPDFVRRLENKVLFCIVQNAMENAIYQNLKNKFNDPLFMTINLEQAWHELALFLADYYSTRAAAIFMGEHYPDKLTGFKVVSRFPYQMVNKQIAKTINELVKKDQTKIGETIEFFLTTKEWLKPKQKTSLIAKAVGICINTIPHSATFPMSIKIEFDSNQFPFFNIEYRP